MQEETRNLILAIVLSGAILFGYQYFVAKPQMEAQQQAQQTNEQTTGTPQPTAQAPTPTGQGISLWLPICCFQAGLTLLR